MDKSEKQELQQTIQYLEIVNSQIKSLSQQTELLEMSSDEHEQAKKTLQHLQDLEPGDELLLPIGAGNFVFGTVKDPSQVFYGVGSNISTIVDRGSAMKKIEERLEEIEGALSKIGENLANLRRQASQLSNRGRQLYQKLQTEEGSSDV